MSIDTLSIELNGLELLLVEDDEVSALVISRVLSKLGASVTTATNGIDGFIKFQEHPFPIVITDINMPVMNGLELVNRIKALDLETQFIATSANRETDCLIAAIELGFSEYLLKPIEIEKLLLAIKRCGEVITVRDQLESERQKFRTVVESLGEGIIVKGLDYQILYQNKVMTKMFGDRTGSPCYTLFDLNEPCRDCPSIESLKASQTHLTCRSYQLNNTTRHIESSVSLLKDSRGTVTGTVEIFRDISERIKDELAIRKMAFLDPLTGLSNRRLFYDRLEQAIAKSRRYNIQFGLLTIDLDNFKNINDTYGHDAGDQVLLEAAERIRACCKRDLDTISRHGGDEFCIICTDCGGKEQLSAIAEELLLQFARPFQLTDTQVVVTTSIGISIFPEHGSDMKELEIASDRAMYESKKAGRNTYMFSLP